MPAARWPSVVAKAIWFAHLAVYVVIAIGALYMGLAFPFVAALSLFAATLLFAAVYTRRDAKLVLIALTTAGLQLLLGVLLLGGTGSTWTVGGKVWPHSPGLPDAFQFPAWMAGLLMPLLLTIFVLRRLRSQVDDSDDRPIARGR